METNENNENSQLNAYIRTCNWNAKCDRISLESHIISMDAQAAHIPQFTNLLLKKKREKKTTQKRTLS